MHDFPPHNDKRLHPKRKEFDKELYDKRRSHFMAMSEGDACSLEMGDRYDRSRYLREKCADEYLRSVNNRSDLPGKEQQKPLSSQVRTQAVKTGPQSGVVIYRDWSRD